MTPHESALFGDDLPGEIKDFIEARIVVGDLALPTHYPERGEIGAWQAGFRFHAITGDSLVSSQAGAWQSGWRVVALNGLDDPFFIDIAEKAVGFPVYYAAHGAGCWDATAAAPSVRRFRQILSALQQVADDDAQVLQLIETETDATNALWREVHAARSEREAVEKEFARPETTYDPADFQQGVLVITDVGSQKLKVAQVLSQVLGLSLKDALASAAQRDVAAGSGSPIELRRVRDKLVGLGASVEFRPDAEPTG